jgi:hypothetical protein
MSAPQEVRLVQSFFNPRFPTFNFGTSHQFHFSVQEYYKQTEKYLWWSQVPDVFLLS